MPHSAASVLLLLLVLVISFSIVCAERVSWPNADGSSPPETIISALSSPIQLSLISLTSSGMRLIVRGCIIDEFNAPISAPFVLLERSSITFEDCEFRNQRLSFYGLHLSRGCNFTVRRCLFNESDEHRFGKPHEAINDHGGMTNRALIEISRLHATAEPAFILIENNIFISNLTQYVDPRFTRKCVHINVGDESDEVVVADNDGAVVFSELRVDGNTAIVGYMSNMFEIWQRRPVTAQIISVSRNTMRVLSNPAHLRVPSDPYSKLSVASTSVQRCITFLFGAAPLGLALESRRISQLFVGAFIGHNDILLRYDLLAAIARVEVVHTTAATNSFVPLLSLSHNTIVKQCWTSSCAPYGQSMNWTGEMHLSHNVAGRDFDLEYCALNIIFRGSVSVNSSSVNLHHATNVYAIENNTLVTASVQIIHTIAIQLYDGASVATLRIRYNDINVNFYRHKGNAMTLDFINGMLLDKLDISWQRINISMPLDGDDWRFTNLGTGITLVGYSDFKRVNLIHMHHNHIPVVRGAADVFGISTSGFWTFANVVVEFNDVGEVWQNLARNQLFTTLYEDRYLIPICAGFRIVGGFGAGSARLVNNTVRFMSTGININSIAFFVGTSTKQCTHVDIVISDNVLIDNITKRGYSYRETTVAVAAFESSVPLIDVSITIENNTGRVIAIGDCPSTGCRGIVVGASSSQVRNVRFVVVRNNNISVTALKGFVMCINAWSLIEAPETSREGAASRSRWCCRSASGSLICRQWMPWTSARSSSRTTSALSMPRLAPPATRSLSVAP